MPPFWSDMAASIYFFLFYKRRAAMDRLWMVVFLLLQFGLFYYQKKYPYVKIEKDALQIGGLLGKTVRNDELSCVKNLLAIIF